MSIGKVILIAGARGTGKTWLLKDRLKLVNKSALLIHDPNGEYKDLFPYPLLSFDEFTAKATMVRGAVIAIEEATIYLNNRGSNSDVIDFLVKSRHRGNTIFLVYHSLRAIPRYIFELSDYVILKKTGDAENEVDRKFENQALTTAFREVITAKGKFATKAIKVNSIGSMDGED